jgi:hypothetical protein
MTNVPPTLTLEHRAGLPDALAYLRAGYPKENWRHHRNFGALSAFWLETHDTLRDHGRELRKAVIAFQEGRSDPYGFRRSFAPRLNGFLQHLNGHHQIEDHAYFPKFRLLDPRMVAGFDLLESDHEVIHAALLASARSGQALVDGLARDPDAARRAADAYAADADRLLVMLLRHLADEEDLILPAMLHHGERSVG